MNDVPSDAPLVPSGHEYVYVPSPPLGVAANVIVWFGHPVGGVGATLTVRSGST
ncbi:hypothetical protein [Fimbriiglobus ruber]|uniref:hypothetical protein n=1 Tax=Fimbriiglobus ruber TaxID=1908690 RepID=UPI00137AD441|nr:hypothetical protein [Fimbriiglobus ruber]